MDNYSSFAFTELIFSFNWSKIVFVFFIEEALNLESSAALFTTILDEKLRQASFISFLYESSFVSSFTDSNSVHSFVESIHM